MKKLAVCGDSWFSSDINHKGKSFGEILSANLGWEFLSLARGGCSNFAISLQVDKAIEVNADFIIVGATTPDRIDIPIINKKNISIWHKLKQYFNWDDWSYYQPEIYQKNRGISNIWHKHRNDLSNHNTWIDDPLIISESLNNLVFTNPYALDSEILDALKSYMLNLYDSGIKRQTDCWIMSDACHRLLRSRIPFLFYIEPLFDPGDHWQTGFKVDIGWLEKKNLVEPWEFSYYHLPKKNPGSFHYDVDEGGVIFADFMQTKMENLL